MTAALQSLLLQKTKKFKASEKLLQRCHIIAKILPPLRSLYQGETIKVSQTQKDLLETIIAASIWYLPDTGLWTGRISRKALKLHQEGEKLAKLTKEHPYPRKRAGKYLLSLKGPGLNSHKILTLYRKKLGQWNFVTPEENRALTHCAKPQRKRSQFN